MNAMISLRAPVAVLAAIVLMTAIAGCHSSDTSSKPESREAQRRELNAGYSLLYQEAKGLTKVKYVVAIKSESDAVDKSVTAMTDYCATVRDQMEAMTRQYPSLRINAKAMPEVLGKARIAMGHERFSHFIPIIGETGLVYERDLLLMMRGAANEESHIAGALADQETDDNLKQYDGKVKKRFLALRDRFQTLLVQHYFVHPSK